MTPRKPNVQMREDAILNALRDHGPLRSTELCEHLGLADVYSELFGREFRYALNDARMKGIIEATRIKGERLVVFSLPGEDRAASEAASDAAPGSKWNQNKEAEKTVGAALSLGSGKVVQPLHGVDSGIIPDEPTRDTIYRPAATTSAQAQLDSKTSLGTKVTQLRMAAVSSQNKSLLLVSEVLEALTIGRPAVEATPVASDADEVEVALAALGAALRALKPEPVKAVDPADYEARREVQRLNEEVTRLKSSLSAMATNLAGVSRKFDALRKALG